MTTKKLTNMSIVQLQNYLINYEEKKGHVPYELKKEIEFQITKNKINNKILANHLINSKWFDLGTIQTIEKGQATRVSVGTHMVYEVDCYNVILNLIDLTFKGLHKKNFDFIKKLGQLEKL